MGRHHGRKLTLTERDRRTLRRIVLKIHRPTEAQVESGTEYVFVLKTLFPQKLSDVVFTNQTSTVGLQFLNL
jgi:hypothetical protein